MAGAFRNVVLGEDGDKLDSSVKKEVLRGVKKDRNIT
jgi:hypothetical protein